MKIDVICRKEKELSIIRDKRRVKNDNKGGW
jgi:hypothetical protein